MILPEPTEWRRFWKELEAMKALARHERARALDTLEQHSGEGRVVGLLRLHFALEDLEPAVLAPGDRIGNLTLGAALGSGGMGVVHEAEQHLGQTTRKVAVKFVRPELWQRTDQVSRDQFSREIDAQAQLQYRGIARLYDAGTYRLPGMQEEVPYLVMELIHGARTITRFAQEERLTVEARLRLFLTACRAVEHAHGKRIIHRDLKPANILVDSDGEPFVVDFGLAQRCDAPTPAAEGPAFGTPGYMSPEQWGTPRGPVSEKSDTYALGMTLRALVTGERPRSGSTELGKPTAVGRLIPAPQSARAWPDTHAGWLRGQLSELIGAALEVDPSKRPTVGAICTAIERLLANCQRVDDPAAWSASASGAAPVAHDSETGDGRQHAAHTEAPFGDAGSISGLEPLQLLQQDAAAELWLARQPALLRLVEVKVLHRMEVLAPDSVPLRRLRREAMTTGQLSNHNIVSVHAVGVTSLGVPYVQMERLDGPRLSGWLARPRIVDLRQALGWLEQLACALAAAHQAGVVHRNVTPDCIHLQDEARRLVLTGFTVADVVESGREVVTQLTRPGEQLSDPRYVSPEQVRGEQTAASTDVYGLGIIAYELLAGCRPFSDDRNLPANANDHILRAPMDLHALRPDLPQPLADLFRECLAKHPAARPSAGRIAGLLKRALSPPFPPAQHSTAPPSPQQEGEGRPSHRWLHLTILFVLGATLLLMTQ
jgi:serine/threonine protein kinase